MVEVSHTAEVDVPVSVVFAYLDDYRNVPTWMFGVSSFEPAGAQIQGLGATYRAAMAIGPKKVKSTVAITEWELEKVITLASINGFENSSSWRFEDLGPRGTRMSVTFDYTLPGGMAGKLLGGLLSPFAEQAIKHTDSTLRREVSRS